MLKLIGRLQVTYCLILGGLSRSMVVNILQIGTRQRTLTLGNMDLFFFSNSSFKEKEVQVHSKTQNVLRRIGIGKG